MDGHALVTSPLDVTFLIVITLVTFYIPAETVWALWRKPQRGSEPDAGWPMIVRLRGNHGHQLRTAHEYRFSVEGQASAEGRGRVRETETRARTRKTA